MRKFISMFMALAMLFASAGITVASAETTATVDPNLIFDMKIEVQGEGYVITDESGNTGYLADDYISYTPPRYGEAYKPDFGTINGTSQNYLIFGVDGRTETSYTRRTLHVKFKDNKGIEFAESNERTYEMWINFQKPQPTKTIFSFGCNYSDYSTNKNHDFQCAANRVQTSDNGKTTWWVYPNRENYTSAANGLNIENNVWKHLVITEEFKETNAQTMSGTWTAKSYVDGELVSTGTVANVPKADFDDGDGTFTTPNKGSGHKANTLSIGCSLAGVALNCSIADFKLYNDVRTSEEIKNDYDSSVENFEETVPTIPPDDANLLFDMKIEADGDDYTVTDESGNTGYLAKNYISYTPARYGVEYKPGLGSGNGTNQNYLIFGVDGQTDYKYTRRTLHVKFKDNKGIEFAESNERTYAMWINFQKPQITKTILSFGCNYNPDTAQSHNYQCAVNRIQTSDNGKTTWWIYPSGENYTSAANGLDIENDVWKHLVITEKFTLTNSASNVGTWTTNSYIDGELVSTGTIANVPKSDFNDGDGTFTTNQGSGHKANTLSIGCSLGGSAFNCSIADFKLYNDVRTPAEIKNDYIVSSKGFGENYDAKLSFRSIEINNNDYFEADTVGVSGKAKVRAVLESNDIADRTYTLVAAVTGDRLYDVDVTRDIALKAGEKKYFEYELDIPDKTEGTHVKLMLLDSLETIKPICEAAAKLVDTKQITMPNIFSDDMILQRGAEVNIFGTAPNGTIAVAEFGDYSAEAETDKGEFVIKLPEMPAENEGKTLTVRVLDGDRNELKVFTYENVVVGDVFYGAGQSNMSMKMSAPDFGDLASRMTVVENARMFNVAQVNSVGGRPSGDTEKWQIIDETNYTDGSATMYPTILKLRELNAVEQDVPIGFVKCAWGGSNLHHWVGTDLLKKWEDEGIYSSPYTNYLNGTEHNGVRHTDLYYSMAQAVTPFTFKAAVWYQGEGETGLITTYPDMASEMIEMMRRDFGYEIPYFIVQLPGCLLWPGTWGSFRFAQLTIPEKTEGDSEYVVVISDTGEANNVHPGDKDVVGERIARRMMKELYGRDDIAWTGPVFESAVADGNNVTISFKQETINDGLCSLAVDDSLEGFQVSSDGSSWKTADAEIVGETIVVSSTEVSNPKYVRFGKVEGTLKSAGSYKTETYGEAEKTVKLPLVQFSEAISN